MDKATIACGTWPLIEYGITQYEREHGRKPVALILHPADIDEFTRRSESSPAVLDGVSVIVSPLFSVAALSEEDGNTHELSPRDIMKIRKWLAALPLTALVTLAPNVPAQSLGGMEAD